MTKGNSKIVDVMLYNNGTGPTGNVYLDLPSVDWLSVVGNDTLPSIAVHDSAYFSLRLSANENTSLVQYTGNIAINCERGDGLSLPYTITAVSDSTGTLVVDVTDDYTYNGNGQHLAGATVTQQRNIANVIGSHSFSFSLHFLQAHIKCAQIAQYADYILFSYS
jgi:hypothetical protein